MPVFGAAPVADGRALFGALFLVPVAVVLGQRISLRERWKDYLAVCLPALLVLAGWLRRPPVLLAWLLPSAGMLAWLSAAYFLGAWYAGA